MSRPQKSTVEYFPHYTASKKTIFTLEGLYGNDGYAFWFKLLEILGSSEGHYYKFCKKADWLYLVSKTAVVEDKAKAILETLVDLEAIDEKLYRKHIIWSDNFIKNVAQVYDKRKGKLPEKPVTDTGNPITDTGNPITDTGNPQSKGSKVKEVKEVYGEFHNVKLTTTEFKSLVERFGEKDTGDKIENISFYLSSKGDKYKSHYATILTWDKRDAKEKGKNSTAQKPVSMTQRDKNIGGIVEMRRRIEDAKRNDNNQETGPHDGAGPSNAPSLSLPE